MKYYAAYGSNLNKCKMADRSPNAIPVGRAVLQGWKLLFQGKADRGFYLTIEPEPGSMVPLGIWQVEDQDERLLDEYEGYPELYEKENLLLEVALRDGNTKQLEVFYYRMNPGYSLGQPTRSYWQECLAGFQDFGLDVWYLEQALKISEPVSSADSCELKK